MQCPVLVKIVVNKEVKGSHTRQGGWQNEIFLMRLRHKSHS